jgi:hypothetical protein
LKNNKILKILKMIYYNFFIQKSKKNQVSQRILLRQA